MKATVIFLAFIFSFTIVKGQNFEHFIVKNTEYRNKNIVPNFEKEPDLKNMEKGVMPKNMNDYTKPNLEVKFPDLFTKVEKLLGSNERLNFLFYYNEKGEVIYGYFSSSEAVIKKLTDEILLEIYNTFKTLKMEIDPNTIKQGKNMVEILNIPFRGK